ncbi:hypothetical protein Hanom_Chr06g00537731 [Helianthus anomalus]
MGLPLAVEHTVTHSFLRFGKGWDQQVQRTMVMVSSDQPTFQSKKKKLGSANGHQEGINVHLSRLDN